MLDRRQILTALGIAPLAACVAIAQAAPGRGWVLVDGPKVLGSMTSGFAQIDARQPFTLDSPFRIASITKLAVSMMAHDLASEGRLDLDAPVGDVFPRAPVTLTLRHLLSHRSGLRDPDIYWAAADEDIRDLFNSGDFTHPPGAYFRYANLNYGLAASVVEARLNKRFDRLMSDWLSKNDVSAGLNWWGTGTEARDKAAALYRKTDGVWESTVDAQADIPAQGGTYLGQDTSDLADYTPGENGTLFSPQGGLRASLLDLTALGNIIHRRPEFHSANWTFDGSNGDNEDAHFLAFGPGSYVYTPDISPIPGVPLVGHLGWAYGAHTGLFIVPGTDLTFAFASLGSGAEDGAMTGGRANQFRTHQALFDALAPRLRAAL